MLAGYAMFSGDTPLAGDTRVAGDARWRHKSLRRGSGGNPRPFGNANGSAGDGENLRVDRPDAVDAERVACRAAQVEYSAGDVGTTVVDEGED